MTKVTDMGRMMRVLGTVVKGRRRTMSGCVIGEEMPIRPLGQLGKYGGLRAHLGRQARGTVGSAVGSAVGTAAGTLLGTY